MKKIFLILLIIAAGGELSAQTSVGVTVGVGTNVTIDAGTTMDVANGNFTVEVAENNRGSFLEIGNLTFSGGGEARMEQYLTKDDWHAVASPMTNENIGVYEWMYLYSWDESTRDWTNLVLPITLPLNPGEGYYVWNTLDTSITYPNTANKVMFNGTFNNSDVVTSPTFTSGGQGSQFKGWNLMGNPFPCAIDWNGDANWNLENVLPTVYLGDYAGSGNYPAWDYSTNTGILKSDGYIAATQGFWIKTDKPGGNPNNITYSLTIPASQRLHSTATPFYKSDKSIIETFIRLRVDGNNFYDEMLISFMPEATPGFDFYYDAHKMKGRVEAPQLYSIVGDEILCMNFLPEVTEEVVVALGFEVGAEGPYTINASEIEGFDSELFIYLEDLKENTIQDLKMNPNYSFTATPIDDAERFLIHFKTTAFDIDENNLEQFVMIYAYNNKIYVDITGDHGGNIIVCNMLGQEMKTAAVSEGKQSIRVDDSGYMLVTLVTQKGVYSEKVFVK